MRITLYELLYRYIYPALRRRLALILYEDFNLKQEEIAKVLSTTQSAISKYVDGRRGVGIRIESIPNVDSELRVIAEKVSKGVLDSYDVQVELSKLIFKLLASKQLCSIHSKLDPTVDYVKCNICPRLFRHYLSNE